MERKYVAFISYRHAELDSAVAKQMHTLIERYVVPKKLRKNGQKKLGIVFRDQEELPVSSDLSDDICRALDNAQYLIVVCTKNTAQSPWVGREISYFLEHHDRNCAFAALAEGEPSEVFPLSLTQIHNPDGTVTDVEPLAIDLRADSIPAMKKKSKREIMRLFAALIGCPYDSLVMREQRRKRRQLASIMAVILAVVTGFSAMTLVKNHQIDQKNQELAGMNQTLEDKNLELEEKNDELARQKAEVQLRESELLTEKSLSNLAAEDIQSAMENALAALPSKTEDRPYYALAEQALTSSLGIYSDKISKYQMFNDTLVQKTPISCYEISPDGTKVMTLDEYGLVTCFDIATKKILWTTQVYDASLPNHIQLLPCEKIGGVIVSIDNTNAAVEWETGAILWDYLMDTDSRVYLSPDGATLAWRSDDMTSDLMYYDYAFEFIDTATGERIHRIEIGTTSAWSNNEEGLSTWQFESYLSGECENGAFSSDGKLFVTSYIEAWETTGKKEHCYLLMDVENGTFRELYRRPAYDADITENTRFLRFVQEDSAVLVMTDHMDSYTAFRLEKIDVQTGKRQWASDTGKTENYFYSSNPTYAAPGINTLYLSRAGYLFVVDMNTGETTHTMITEADIVAMEWVESPFISIILSDGAYTLAWSNSSGIYTSDYYFGPYLDMGTAVSAKLWNNGIVRMVVEDGMIQRTHVGTTDDPNGTIISMSQEGSNTLEVKRAINFGSLVESSPVDLMPEKSYNLLDSNVKDAGKNKFIFGKYLTETEDGQRFYSCRMVDRDTYEVQETPKVSILRDDYLYCLSDGSGYITIDRLDGMILYGMDGSQKVLWEPAEASFPDYPDQTYYPYTFAAGVQADGRLLTVAMSEGKLHWWMDGKDKKEIDIPADICSEKVVKNTIYRFLAVHENDLILIANYADTDEMHIQNFAAYDISEDTWYRFATDRDVTKGSAGMAREHNWLILNDDTNDVYIYDMQTDKLLYQFPLQLPLNSVEELGLVLEDAYLCVKTGDLQVFLYDITTGEIVYNTQLEGYSGGSLHIEEDKENHRVYIWDDESHREAGVCLDKDSWTELAEIPGFLYYDSLRNKLYCYRTYGADDEGGEGVIVFTPPTLEELVEMGEKLLNE